MGLAEHPAKAMALSATATNIFFILIPQLKGFAHHGQTVSWTRADASLQRRSL
ncbi:hypothetical protein [Sinomonas sp. P10A9]|uniref:Uncharacterized protein n=1 Tax=Sinomonas puerhi TaxID=3238584 RepID=A0AB39L5N9_9MICC